jgi:hypothetical protein
MNRRDVLKLAAVGSIAPTSLLIKSKPSEGGFTPRTSVTEIQPSNWKPPTLEIDNDSPYIDPLKHGILSESLGAWPANRVRFPKTALTTVPIRTKDSTINWCPTLDWVKCSALGNYYIDIPNFGEVLVPARYSHGTINDLVVPIYQNSESYDLQTDTWHVILSMGADKNLIVYDQDCRKGFSKRLASLMKMCYRRNHSQLLKREGLPIAKNKKSMTHLFMSEQKWEEFLQEHGPLVYISAPHLVANRLFNIVIVPVRDLDVDGKYDKFLKNELLCKHPVNHSSDTFIVGMDLARQDYLFVLEPDWEPTPTKRGVFGFNHGIMLGVC